MKYRYLILPEDGDVWGCNDRDDALTAAADNLVIDVESAVYVDEDGDVGDEIDLWHAPIDPEDEEDDE